jgi:hypothetical protein
MENLMMYPSRVIWNQNSIAWQIWLSNLWREVSYTIVQLNLFLMWSWNSIASCNWSSHW